MYPKALVQRGYRLQVILCFKEVGQFNDLNDRGIMSTASSLINEIISFLQMQAATTKLLLGKHQAAWNGIKLHQRAVEGFNLELTS